MAAGYSGTPLMAKLGIKAGFSLRFVHPPAHYPALLGPLPENTRRQQNACNFIHAFYKDRSVLESEIAELMTAIERDGMIWISWPKKSSKVPTDITEDTIRDIVLPMGLVDVKVCAVDDVWSGLKLMIRKELR